MKHSNMQAAKKLQNAKKLTLAKQTLQSMIANEEAVSVTELSKRTGLSKSFYYKNPQLRVLLQEAFRIQSQKPLPDRKSRAIIISMQHTIELQKKQIESLKEENYYLHTKLAAFQTSSGTDLDYLNKL